MTFSLSYVEGDLSNPPPRTLAVHACNCQGQLGAGVALAMKKAFPVAHELYVQRCEEAGYGEQLRGKCFLIPPQLSDAESFEFHKGCWIGCLLTSHGYGSKAVKSGKTPHPKKDEPEMIKQSTRKALESLKTQMEQSFGGDTGKHYPEVWSNRMNAGFFGVDWNETEDIIRGVFEDMDLKWTVVDFEN